MVRVLDPEIGTPDTFEERIREAQEAGEPIAVAALELQRSFQKPWLEWIVLYNSNVPTAVKALPTCLAALVAELVINGTKDSTGEDKRCAIAIEISMDIARSAVEMIQNQEAYGEAVHMKVPVKN